MLVTYMIGEKCYVEHWAKSLLNVLDEMLRSVGGVILAVRED